MKDCYYVLARIVAKSSSGQAVDEVMGLAIMAHPVNWALNLNYVPGLTEFKITPLFFEKIPQDAYEAASQFGDIFVFDGLVLGLKVTK